MKKQLRKMLALLLVVMMTMTLGGCAEEKQPETAPVPEATEEIVTEANAAAGDASAEETEPEQTPVVDDPELEIALTVNGDDISAALVMQYAEYQEANGYTETVDYEQAINALIEIVLVNQKIKELGLDQYTEDEKAAFMLDAQLQWDTAISEYVSYYLTEDTEEARAQAKADAEAYYGAHGYSVEVLYDQMLNNESFNRLLEHMMATGDVTVTDEEVRQAFMEYAQMDEMYFKGQIPTYEYYTQYSGYQALYVPEGYRGVTHILLQVEEELLTNYQNLAAQLEEEGTTVTQADVDAALQAVLASRQEDMDSIYARLENGESFETLIAEFGTDPGMQDARYLAEGYPVHKESIVYDPVFTAAAFSEKMVQVGDVSDPVVGSYGIHILYYLRDLPAGVVEMTEDIRAQIYDSLLMDKQNTVVNAQMQKWVEESTVVRNEEVIASLSVSESLEME